MMTIQAIRKALRDKFGPRNYRVTSAGEIHAYGVMPNSNVTGWYLYGQMGSAETEVCFNALADTRHKERFATIYRAQFAHYQLPGSADRNLAAIYADAALIDGPACKATMRVLGIKPTRKALREFFTRDGE